MKYKSLLFFAIFSFIVSSFLLFVQNTYALDYFEIKKTNFTPAACTHPSTCPNELWGAYGSNDLTQKPAVCATSFNGEGDAQSFDKNPSIKHYWVEDPEITDLGKTDERARQFIYWAITMRSQTFPPVPAISKVWSISMQIALVFVVIVAVMLGLGYIVGQRTSFQLNIQLWPSIIKLGLMLLYIVMSLGLVIFLIQLADILMRFFMDNLGGSNLFNIYFSTTQSGGPLGASEANYTDFVGCRDLNLQVAESIKTQIFMLKLTNITYYTMGVIIILRQVLLWFLAFAAPFLAILMPFTFIRNTGWIWIGVFFQWLFYGPLFALFLGALNAMWSLGMPFIFSFDRAGDAKRGYIFPTATNITYGGPAQKLSGLNSSNYIDTFAEYIITLIMLWAVIFFPWWLLRIFRDYCCDGIYAAKNILLAMYEQMRKTPQGPKPSTPSGTLPSQQKEMKMPTASEVEVRVTTKLQTMEQIKRVQTTEITKNLSLTATKLTDIARMEMNKETRQTVQKNLNFLSNPIKAQTPAERQQYMNLRTELFSRAVKNDTIARTLLSTTSTSRDEKIRQRTEIIKSIPQNQTISQVVSVQTKIPQQKVSTITNSYMTSVVNNKPVVNNISKITNVPASQVSQIINNYASNTTNNTNQVVKNIAAQTKISESKVREVLKTTGSMIRQSNFVSQTASKENIKSEHVSQVLQSISSSLQTTSTVEKQKAAPAVTAAQHATPLKQETLATVTKETVKETAKPVTKTISLTTNLPEAKAQTLATTVMTSIAQDNSIVENIQKQSGLKAVQVQNVLTTIAQNVNQAPDVLAERISQSAGVEKSKVSEVVQIVSDNINASKDLVKDVATKEGVKEEDVSNIIETEMPLAAEPEQHVEQNIAIPPSISIEEYQDVLEMWTKQYEEGEVPVTENIQSREEWVEQDIVMLTNTLNKLMSTDESLQQEGLDELGFILPVFMINNLKGDQLLVYLKAKLQGAKAVQKQLDKENTLKETWEKEKQKQEDDEELVEVAKPKEEEKHMEADMDEEEDKPKELTDEDVEKMGTPQPKELGDDEESPLGGLKEMKDEE